MVQIGYTREAGGHSNARDGVESPNIPWDSRSQTLPWTKIGQEFMRAGKTPCFVAQMRKPFGAVAKVVEGDAGASDIPSCLRSYLPPWTKASLRSKVSPEKVRAYLAQQPSGSFSSCGYANRTGMGINLGLYTGSVISFKTIPISGHVVPILARSVIPMYLA